MHLFADSSWDLGAGSALNYQESPEDASQLLVYLIPCLALWVWEDCIVFIIHNIFSFFFCFNVISHSCFGVLRQRLLSRGLKAHDDAEALEVKWIASTRFTVWANKQIQIFCCIDFFFFFIFITSASLLMQRWWVQGHTLQYTEIKYKGLGPQHYRKEIFFFHLSLKWKILE